MKKFANYEELQKFLADNNNPESATFGGVISVNALTAGSAVRQTAASPATAPTAGVSKDSSVSSESTGSNANLNALADYSSTNNQVVGVDEADIIKTDGQYIYALVRNDLFIIKAVPASEAQIISKISFASRPEDIFIDGTSLAVFGNDQEIYAQPLFATFRRQNQYTFFKVFDLSDPANPKQVRDLDFEGYYSDARLIGDYVYLITNTYLTYILKETPVPRVLENGQVLATTCAGDNRCFAPDVYYFDLPYDAFNYTNITAINIKDNAEAITGQAYLMNNSQTVYVSQNNIYLTYTQYISEYQVEQEVKRAAVFPLLAASEKDKITAIEAAPDYILNDNEKRYKVAQIIDYYLAALPLSQANALQTTINDKLKAELTVKAKDMEKTIIHKIAINGNKVEYQGRGEVSGRLLNQFSLDENGDYFRLATTRSRQWNVASGTTADSYSNVYVLDNNLKVIGALENLATSEQIYAARFLGDRVYLVTFKQTDPLYVISLSDPTKPAVLGAVKIPGFSNYLHPVDANGNKLISLGRATTEDAKGNVQIQGLKLSLFDFTDLSHPKELDSYLIGGQGSDSIAIYDHKAFLYSTSKNLLVIPALLSDNGQLSFSGALVFTLANDKFVLKGKIDHSAGGHFAASDYWQGFNYYDNTVKRSLYINDDLYTFSNKFLQINALADLAAIKSLTLTIGGDDYIITAPPSPAVDTEAGTSGSSTPELLIPSSSPAETEATTSPNP